MFRRLEQLGKAWHHAQRFKEIVAVFLKYGYEDLARRLHLPTSLGFRFRRHPAEPPEAHLSAPERLRRACEELGPTFIKLGQILSTRPQLLPDGYADELARLQDSVAPIPFEHVLTVVRTELKSDPASVFASIDPQPIGSASIAQVHRARLLDGSDVVIKVQRPGIRRRIEVDIEILAHLAALMETHLEAARTHRPTAVVAEFARTIEQELDFTAEAAHIDRFALQFQGDPTLLVPTVHRALTTRTVLVMQYVPGIKASELNPETTSEADRTLVAQRVADLVIRQIFVHGFFHADPHPGNIHVLPDGRICFLDFGMMGYIDQRGREAFADLLWGIVRRDEVDVAHALIRLAAADHEPRREGLESEVAEFMHRHFYRPVGEIEFGRLIAELLQITARHELRIPPDFFTMIKALGHMEGLARKLNPNHNLLAQAKPYLRDVRLARLKPRNLLDGLFSFGIDFAEMARELPSELRRIFSQLKSGEARLIFRHDGLDPLIHSWDRVSNRLSFAIVLASLIIGSSLILHAKLPPTWHGIPIIGLVGFIVAGLMGFWLLISILRHGRM